MALHGEGEPQPTLIQVATQAATIELFTQWQTYKNGVHWDYDSFRSVDFRAIAVAVLTAAGFEITADDVADHPQLRKLLTRPTPFAKVEQRVQEEATREHEARRAYSLSAADVAAHGEQVQG